MVNVINFFNIFLTMRVSLLNYYRAQTTKNIENLMKIEENGWLKVPIIWNNSSTEGLNITFGQNLVLEKVFGKKINIIEKPIDIWPNSELKIILGYIFCTTIIG